MPPDIKILGFFLKATLVLVMFIGVFSHPSLASAQVVSEYLPRVEQLTKDTYIASPSQRISCSRLRGGTIKSVTVSGASGWNTLWLEFSSDGSSGGVVKQESDHLVLSGGQVGDITFGFSSPIIIDSNLCSGAAESVVMSLRYSGLGSAPYLNGSHDSNSFPDGELVSETGDLYFIINGVAEINNAPVITSSDSVSGNEGEFIKYKVTGYDKDQTRQTFTVSAGQLPPTATLSGDTITWVPDFDQAGVHEIEVSVTDDGNGGVFLPITVTKKVIINVADKTITYPRFDQLTKDTVITSAAQFISCSKLRGGTIKSVTVSGVTGWNNVWLEFSSDGSAAGAIKQESDHLALTGGPARDITFNFSSPVVIDSNLCSGSAQNVVMSLRSGAGSTPYYFGSSSSTSFADGELLVGTGDLYFIINGIAEINHAPIITSGNSAVGSEGEYFKYKITGYDQDQSKQTFKISANQLPATATLSGDTISWVPDFDQAGAHEIEVSITDDGNGGLFPPITATKKVVFNIADKSIVYPRVEQLVKDNLMHSYYSYSQTISCNDVKGGAIKSVTLNLSASGGHAYWVDILGDGIVSTPGNVKQSSEVLYPYGARKDLVFNFLSPVFVDSNICANNAQTALIRLNTSGDPGSAIYGSASSSAYLGGEYDNGPGDMYFIINYFTPKNTAPEITLLGDSSITLKQNESYIDPGVTAIDKEDGDLTSLVQIGGDLVDTKVPGIYSITYDVTDSGGISAIQAKRVVIVEQTNSSPSLDSIGNKEITEGEKLEFIVSAMDPEGDKLQYSASNLPIGALLDASSGLFVWTPDYNQSGLYENIVFSVSDGGNPLGVASETISIKVDNTNRAPLLSKIGNKVGNEGEAMTFAINSTDPDGNNLVYSAGNLPLGASFDPVLHVFSWTPGYSQSGNYNDIEFTVIDDGDPIALATELITITIGDVNRAPVFDSVGAYEVLEKNSLEFGLHATDPDGDTVLLTAGVLPAGAVFDISSGLFTWTPARGQAGTYIVHFDATDSGKPSLSSGVDVSITVGENMSPVEQSENLVNSIISSNLPDQLENSYLANIKKLPTFIQTGKLQPAINQTNIFIAKVKTDISSGRIVSSIGNEFIALAEKILIDLGR